jgi:cytochrome c-type biogenesis protein CcmH/NrfG
MYMSKGASQRPSSNPATWTSGQAYALALVCLGIGLLVGWFFRGSESPSSAPISATVGGGNAPASAPAMGQQQAPPPIEMVNKEAEPMLQQLSSNPNNFELITRIGNLYYDTQHYEKAIEYYGKALKVNPSNVNVRTDMATAMFYIGNPDGAIKEFEAGLKYEPNHPNTLFNLGVVKWQGKQDPSGAVAIWEKLLKTNPNYPEKDKVQEFIGRAKQHSTMPPFSGKQG